MKDPIRYTRHLTQRLALREIDYSVPEQIIRNAERIFFDSATGYRIAVAKVPHRGGKRFMMVAFEETEDEILAVTIHPLDEKDIQAKIRSGRWIT